MKELLIIRHAKSAWDNPSLPDFKRPLSARGKRDVPFMGSLLGARNILPDLIISSPATRALKTAEVIADTIGYAKKRIVFRDDIYEAMVGDLLKIIQSLDETVETVALVGHNPGLTDLANHLSNSQVSNIPTCGILSLSFDIDSWDKIAHQTGKMRFYEYPKKFKS